MSSFFLEFTRLSCSKDNTTVSFNHNNYAVVSKTKTPKTKTEDPLENEDPVENEDPLENEEPLKKKIASLFRRRIIR